MKLHFPLLSSAAVLLGIVPQNPDEPPAAEPTATAPVVPGGVSVAAAASRIDALVEAQIRRAGQRANPRADDAAFLRRTYLGLAGRIPTLSETTAFLGSQDHDKRARLIDSLIGSPGYQSHMFNFWADLLRVKSRLNNQVSGEPFIHFIKQSIADNKPYDKFVREMLVAEGPAHAQGNGATGLLMRDRGMPLDSMANTVRVFLGTRLECAQCHDHPFDKWKQKDFYEMAAFAGGVAYRAQLDREQAPALAEVAKELRDKRDRQGLQALGRLVRGVQSGISGTGTGLIRLPKDYKYDNGKANQLVRAKAIFGTSPAIAVADPNAPKAKPKTGSKSKRKSWRERQRERQEAQRRQREMRQRRNQVGQRGVKTRDAFADWLTAKSNPRFTRVIANRMWEQAMGRALIEPVDNLMDNTKASNQKLMEYLEQLMVQVGYDLQKFQRILFNTATFQRQVTRTEVPSDQTYLFQGPVLRRMTAEQIWDSMLTFVVPDLDATLMAPGARAKLVYDGFDRLVKLDADQLRDEVQKQKLRFTDPKKFREMQQRAGRDRVQKLARDRQAKAQQQREQRDALNQKLAAARKAGDRQQITALEGELAQLRGNDAARAALLRNRGRGPRGRTDVLLRASDLPAPAPEGHFLRRFGQSDRDQIQDSHTEANVPQVLSLLNGFLDRRVLPMSRTELMRGIYTAPAPGDRVDAAYLSILNRAPRGRERAVWVAEIEAGGRKVIKDMVWTLVNSHEFRFIR